MFGSVLQQAKVTIKSSISEAVDRALVAVPFLVAGGFLTTALAAFLIRSYGLEMGALIVGVLFLLVGLIVSSAVRTSTDEIEETTAAGDEAAAAQTHATSGTDGEWWSEAEQDVIKAAAAAAVPYTVPILARLALRNLPLIAAVAAALFVLTRSSNQTAEQPYGAPAE